MISAFSLSSLGSSPLYLPFSAFLWLSLQRVYISELYIVGIDRSNSNSFEKAFVLDFLGLTDAIKLSFEGIRYLVRLDAEAKSELVKMLHDAARQEVIAANKRYTVQGNRGRKPLLLQPGDWVWIYKRDGRFKRKGKLDDRGAGPFQVLEKVNDNAYKIELPPGSDISPTFNVQDLMRCENPFDDPFDDLRSDPSKPGGNDVNQGDHSIIQKRDPLMVRDGPMTRSRRKKLRDSYSLMVQKIVKEEIDWKPTEETVMSVTTCNWALSG